MAETAICKRCLLKEMNAEEYFNTIQEYLEAIPVEEKASEDVYMQRLDSCKQCEGLINGMCKFCGCFVELRAAKLRQHCAGIAQRW